MDMEKYLQSANIWLVAALAVTLVTEWYTLREMHLTLAKLQVLYDVQVSRR